MAKTKEVKRYEAEFRRVRGDLVSAMRSWQSVSRELRDCHIARDEAAKGKDFDHWDHRPETVLIHERERCYHDIETLMIRLSEYPDHMMSAAFDGYSDIDPLFQGRLTQAIEAKIQRLV